MDFRGRSSQPVQTKQTTPAQPSASQSSASGPGSYNNQLKNLSHNPGKLLQYGSIILLFAVTGLVIALTFLLALGGNTQQRAVLKDKYQAVFLNNGQVYFGNISSIDDKTVDLRNIYYLQTGNSDSQDATAASSAPISLVKLGCELHAPYDQMLINNAQVIFWENLQDSGQVVEAIVKDKKENKQKNCPDPAASSTQQAPSTTAPAPTPTTTNPPTTTPTPARKP